MKSSRFIVVALVIGFIAVAVFGFLGMDAHHGSMDACIASLAGKVCVPSSDQNPFSESQFHLDAYRYLSTSIVKSFESVGAMVGIILAFIVAWLFASMDRGKEAISRILAHSYSMVRAFPSHAKYHAWLSQLEKQDPDYCR